MTKWLVLWVVMNMFPVPCSAPEPVPSEYGIESSIVAVNAVACFDSTSKEMRKTFDTKKEAEEFVEKGKEKCDSFFDCGLSDWQIVEIAK